jgi:hypothetical protein
VAYSRLLVEGGGGTELLPRVDLGALGVVGLAARVEHVQAQPSVVYLQHDRGAGVRPAATTPSGAGSAYSISTSAARRASTVRWLT